MTPKYDSSQHGRYVGRLNDALYKQNCKNVALSGSYGSGKSSILEQFAKEAKAGGHYIAKVSLANFVPPRAALGQIPNFQQQHYLNAKS